MKRILYPVETIVDAGENKKVVKWEGLDPLEMATRIAALVTTTQADTPILGHLHNFPPTFTNLDTKFLASDTPILPEKIIKEMENLSVEVHDHTEENYSTKNLNKTNTCATTREFKPDQSNSSLDRYNTRAGTKRGRLVDYDDLRFTYTNKNANASKKIDPWDMSFMSDHNPDQFAVRCAMQHFRILVSELEALPCFKECISSYVRVQRGFLEVSTIISKSKDNSFEKSQKFYDLYSTVIQQLHELIVIVTKMEKEKNKLKNTTAKSANKDLKKESYRGRRTDPDWKAFNEYMNEWMRNNWENPYPDEECMEELAQCIGTTMNVVNNWLINARTRKWRPAIIKAFKLGRPADMLKEDAISIFDGKGVMKDITGNANVAI